MTPWTHPQYEHCWVTAIRLILMCRLRLVILKNGQNGWWLWWRLTVGLKVNIIIDYYEDSFRRTVVALHNTLYTQEWRRKTIWSRIGRRGQYTVGCHRVHALNFKTASVRPKFSQVSSIPSKVTWTIMYDVRMTVTTVAVNSLTPSLPQYTTV